MFKIYDQLIGIEYSNIEIEFTGSDNHNKFLKNLKSMPKEWYYRTHTITYKLNSFGHRCEDINSLNFENYILFIGDSHPYGTGLELEKTFPYVVSKKLNISYYNLGVPGTGVDVISHNLNIWLSKFPKPKYVFLTWADITRSIILPDTKSNLFIGTGTWSKEDDEKNLIRYGDSSGYFSSRYYMTCNMIKCVLESHQIPYSSISLTDTPLNGYMPIRYFSYLHMPDRARDIDGLGIGHIGIESSQIIADYLIAQYNDKYMNATTINTGTV